jgi:hypothetical protein
MILLALLLAAANLPSIALGATLSPARVAPLVPVTIAVTLTSRDRQPVTLEFPTPDLFFVQVRDSKGKPFYDSRTGHKPIPIRRTSTFAPGTTRLASFDWNGLSDERRPPEAPATYLIHVEMQMTASTLVVDVPLIFEGPTTIAAVLAASKPAPATIAGTPEHEGATMFLRDATGRVALSRPLGILPQGRFLVRGQLERTADGTQFVIERSAPAAENLAPQGTPTPRASATPK